MDETTGVQVAVALAVPVPRERMRELVTAVDRIGDWSPEAIGGSWCDEAQSLAPGAEFIGRNRYPDGSGSTVTCRVIEVEQPGVFAWAVLDDVGAVGSTWRCELREGGEPGGTIVHHSFTHGPGDTGARVRAAADPGALDGRLVSLCRNMVTTIVAMAADSPSGAGR